MDPCIARTILSDRPPAALDAAALRRLQNPCPGCLPPLPLARTRELAHQRLWAIDPRVPRVAARAEPHLCNGETFARRFGVRFPLVAQILRECEGRLYAAGGAVVTTLLGLEDGGDVDLFLQSSARAMEDLAMIQRRLRECDEELHDAIRFGMYEATLRTVKLQVILTIQDRAELLDSFDLASCRVAYDGRDVEFAPTGAIAWMYGVNVVGPMLTPNDAYRVLKYCTRGFSAVFPFHAVTPQLEASACRATPRSMVATSIAEYWAEHQAHDHAHDQQWCLCSWTILRPDLEHLPRTFGEAFPDLPTSAKTDQEADWFTVFGSPYA